jgi:hypothetical protein
MPFSRALAPARAPGEETLTRQMVGIGMAFAAPPEPDANIEDTLLFASAAGMEQRDLRVLAVLTTWLGVHAPRVLADRLVQLVTAHTSDRVRAYWNGVATWLAKDRRFARLARQQHGAPRVDLLPTGTEFQVRRHGEDPRFAGSALRVPANVLRDRPADVLEPAELARVHRTYRWRIVIGPTYRADMWAALEAYPQLSAAELARRTYGSFPTAWHVRRDFLTWRAASGGHEPPAGTAPGHGPSVGGRR